MIAPEGHARLAQLVGSARRRELAIVLALALPILAAGVFVAWRLGGFMPALLLALPGTAMAAALGFARLRTLDVRWAARRLDARQPALEDSTALLLQPEPAPLSRLQRLQRMRIAQRVDAIAADELRRAWPLAAISASATVALALVLGTLAWTWSGGPPAVTAPGSQIDPTIAGETRITQARIGIVPPDYTGLPERVEGGLDASAPEGSRLHWTLRFDPEPESAQLRFIDGSTLGLQRRGREWTAELRLVESQLYRIEAGGGPPVDPRMRRLDAVLDQAPRVSVIEPDQNVVYADPDPSPWALVFEARDDHGLGEAELVLTLAQGSGELVDFSEMRSPIIGSDLHEAGEPPRRRYTATLDPARLGFGVGDDLVARMEVRDNREPDAQLARSAAVVLRSPPPAMGEVAGFDGLMQRVMPAYFRSQRQIILDAEALIAERDELERERFVSRSNDIGVDQQLLRLRYGQFMGEEAEGGELGHDHDHGQHDAPPGAAGSSSHDPGTTPPARAPRVSNPLFADDAVHQALDDEAEPAPAEPGHAHDPGSDRSHGHEHAHEHDSHDEQEPVVPAAGGTAGFGGDPESIVARFGHMHDIPEAATLLDPQTRETLRGALRAMWAAEGALRMGDPDAALPHANEALELIQQVRQANRIHLARVGLELPPIDESRRLSGDLDDVDDRPDPIAAALDDTRGLAELWSALATRHDPDADAPDFDAAVEWILAHRDELEDPLGLVEAIDALRLDPGCQACADRLRAQLWPALTTPATGVRRRASHGDAGETYLRRIRVEEAR